MRLRVATILGVLALTAAACGRPLASDPATAPTGTDTAAQLSVTPASFDLATGEDVRFIAGVATQQGLVVGGEVRMRFSYLGQQQGGTVAPTGAEPVGTTAGTFLPVPGKGPTAGSGAPIVSDSGAVGVYETTVDLDRPGFYTVSVQAEVDGRQRTGTGSFAVGQTHRVPAVGDAAPDVANPTVDEPGDAAPGAIDSRARNNDGTVPDPALHDTTVRAALQAGRPMVVLISTPVYCRSRFCGPITDAVEDLQTRYGDRAQFIHLEVWRDFESNTLNPSAAEWIRTEQGGNEPWTFLVGADGTIRARWDNVLDVAELEQMLQDLPA